MPIHAFGLVLSFRCSQFKMKKLIESYLSLWYVPVLVSVAIGLLGFFTIQYPSEIILWISLGFPTLAILASGLLGLIRLLKRDYKKALLQIGLTSIVAVIGFAFASFFLMLYPYDFYASSLSIPEGIQIHEPGGTKFRQVVIHSGTAETKDQLINPSKTDFELRNSSQPGLYEIDAWVGKTDSGKIYLKAFEITKNDPLSEPYLQMKSSIEVVNPTDSIRKFSSADHFTIYEGDWGDYYAARFELWYKPNGSNPEVLLAEKNYRIEGWMR